MARKVTFEIITTAQTKQLRELNKLLNDVKRSADGLGKVKTGNLAKNLGLDKVDTQIKSVNKSITGLNTRLTSLDKKLDKIGKNVGKLGNEFVQVDKSFTKTANSATKMGKSLNEGAQGITKIEKASGRAQKTTDQLEKNFEDARRAASGLGKTLGTLEDTMRRRLPSSATNGSRQIQTFTTDLRDLSSMIGKLDAQRQKMRRIPEEMAEAEEKLARAKRDSADAQSRLNKIQQSGAQSIQEVEEAQKAYNRAQRSMGDAEKDVRRLRSAWDKLAIEVKEAETVLKRVQKVMDDPDMKDVIPKQAIQRIKTMGDAVKSLGMTFQGVAADQRRAFGTMSQGFGQIAGRMKQLEPIVGTLKEVRREVTALGRVRLGFQREDIGNTLSAMNQMTKAVRDQGNEARKIVAERGRLTDATNNWRTAEIATSVALHSGNDALKEKNRLSTLYTSALSKARSVETTLAKNSVALERQQIELKEQRLALTRRLTAAESAMNAETVGSARYLQTERQVQQLTSALRENQTAIDSNTANVRENKQAWQEATSQVNRVEVSQSRLKSSMASITQEMAQQALQASRLGQTMRSIFMGGQGFDRNAAFRGMLNVMQSVNRIAIQLAKTLGSVLRSAITAAANAARGFVNSTGSMFAGLQRALQSSSGFFRDFANNVVRSMDRARMSMLEFYAAGYSLLTVGSQIQQVGNQIFRGMGRQFEGYLEYERAALRSAGASADVANDFTVDMSITDDLVFLMQRGQLTPQWMQDLSGTGGGIPVTFDAQELAQGIYYYSAALGQPVTRENMGQVGEIVQTVMQMAKVTGTEIETAMKGVLNIAMEFGIDARDLTPEGAETIQKVTAQVGMLANMSTMEVSDIIESFKMMGPFLNLLSGGDPGAGLEEAFMAVFAASEVGLRGGNIGRGLSQAFQSLLDPTPKMIEMAGKYFPEIIDTATFNEVFFEETEDGTSRLKGGLTGFFRQIADITDDPVEQSRLLAELFTSNATRGMVGVTSQINDTIGGMSADELLAQLEGNDPLTWLAKVAAATADSVSGWFDYMGNAWFQFVNSVTKSISGPLMNGFRLIGEVLFELAERINVNPRIGQAIASIVGAIASLATIGGTVMIAAGGILLLGRAFAMLGGLILPAIRMFAMAGVTLLGLVPLILVLGTAIGLAVAAYKSNFLGLRDGVERVQLAFNNFDTMILPIIERFLNGLATLGRAFNEFVNGILIGTGTVGTLNMVIMKAFGPLLGDEIMGGLHRLRESLNSTREALREFFSVRTFGTGTIIAAGQALRGFFEQALLGRMSQASYGGAGVLGAFLGIENFHNILIDAGNAFNTFMGQVIGYARIIWGVWAAMASDIRSNLVRALAGFGDAGMSDVFRGIGLVAQGVVQGIIAAFTMLLGAVEWATGKIADFSESLRNAGSAGREILGFTVTFEGALRAIGAAIGLFFGARLVMAFGPFMTMLIRLLPIMTGLASVIVGVGGRLLVMAANIAITTAAWVAHTAVIVGVTIAQWALTAANAALGVASAVAASASTGHVSILTLLGGIATLASAAMTTLTWATAAYSAGALTAAIATQAIVASMVIVTFGAMLLVGALVAIVAVLAGVAAIMLVNVAATQGLGAAFQAAWSMAQGLWSGLQLGIWVITTIASGIANLVTAMGDFLGVGNQFESIGFAIGAAISGIIVLVTALIVALGVLAVAWVAANWPIVAIIAGITALGVAIAFIAANWDGHMQAMEFSVLGFAESALSSVDAVIGSLLALASVSPDFLVPKALEEYSGSPLLKSIQDRRGVLAQEIYDYNEEQLAGANTISEGNNVLMSALDTIGWGDEAREIALKYKIDLENPTFDDLQTVFSDMMGMGGEFSDEEMWVSVLGPSGRDYAKAKSDWDEYSAILDMNMERYGGNAEKAKSITDSMWRGMYGLHAEIPTEPMLGTYLAQEAESITQSAEEIAASLAEANKSISDFISGMTLAGSVDLFKSFEGLGDVNTVGSMLTKVGDKIIQNAGDVPWLNMTELLMDAAGTSDFNADTAGQNIHDALRPALEHTARQLGVTVESLLVDVPKFMAPEGLVNIMTGEMLGIIDDMPADLYSKLDTVGIAQGWSQFGLDWGELATYGAGMAMEGLDWNLATYLAESYGISVAEAESALRAIGIDPNIIGDQVTEMTEQAALTMDGSIQVLTEDMYNMAEQLRQGANGAAISISESELRNLPDSVKLYLASLGYVFVTDDTPAKATAWGDAINAAVNDITFEQWNALPAEVQEFMTSIGVQFDDNGIPIMAWDWLQRLTEAVDTEVEWKELPESVRAFLTSIGWEFENANTANQISAWGDEVASAALAAAEKIAEAMRMPVNPADGGVTGQWFPVYGETPETTWSGYMPRQVGDYQSMLDNLGNAGAANRPLGPNQIPGPEVKFTADTSEVSQAATQVTNEINNISTAKVKVEVDFQHFSGSMSNLLVTLDNAFSGISESMKLKINLDTEDVKTQLNNVLGVATGEGAAQSVPYKVRVTPDLTEFMSWMNTIQTQFAGTGIKVKIQPDLTEFMSWMGTIQSHFSTTGVKIKVTYEVEDDALSFLNELPGAPMGKTPAPKITVTLETADAVLAVNTLNTALTGITKAWLPVISIIAGNSSSIISGLQAQLTTLAKAYIATISVLAGNSSSIISGLQQQLNDLAGAYVVTVTIHVLGLQTLQSAINAINNMPKSKTSTITLNTNNVTTNTTYTNNLTTPKALGGRVGSAGSLAHAMDLSAYARGGSVNATEYALVGEWGPEIVKLPVGSFVHTARETEQMMTTNLSRNTFNVPGEQGTRQEITVQQPEMNKGDTFHFHGDIHIGDRESATAFFDEIDRRAGRKMELARRGQASDNDYRRW